MSFFNFHHHQPNCSSGIYNLELNSEIPNFGFSIGLHPEDIQDDWSMKFEEMKDLSLSKNCLAIGECGLDKLVAIDFNLQKKVFQEHISWANEIQKPIIIHCVRSFSEILSFKKDTKPPMIIHGYNKKKVVLDELLSKGFFLSFGKAVLHNVSLQEIVKDFPLDKLFLETDNANFDISNLYQKVADLKSISLETLQGQINFNLETILNK